MKVTDSKTSKEYYQALVNRDASYTGSFYVGVRTTSIFCIPTCRARKPKFENVEFFTSLKEVLDHGYRPCKVCKPTKENTGVPSWVKRAIKLVEENPKSRVSDQLLREKDLNPENTRRWFQKNYGITFHQYQRMFRINNAYSELRNGETATQAAFDSGYGSLSGFGYTFKTLTGASPTQSKKRSLLYLTRTDTPLGPMFICASHKGICLLEFVDRKMLETEFRDIQTRLKASIIVGENEHTNQAKIQLKEYFEGSRQVFSMDLDAPGTNFQTAVWNQLQKIPFGATTTYSKQAKTIAKPTAIRAMARANGANRIAIVIPCHRVIGKDGSLVGYGGGIERKKWLLEHESRFR